MIADGQAAEGDVVDASFGQERLWFLDRLSRESGAYLIGNMWRIRGRLDRPCWQGALDDVAARHEVLRTCLVEVDGRPMQHISPAVRVQLEWHELPAGRSGETPLEQSLASARTLCATSFDLSRAPLMRCGVWAVAEDEFVLAIVVHHAICDGLSMQILIDELLACYEARLAGTTAELPELAVQYADFVAWLRELLEGTLEGQLEYWREALAGTRLLELPTDRPRPAVRSGRGDTVSLVLPARLVDGLQALGREHGATLFMTLLAAYQVVLARWSGQDDLVVGTPIAGRSQQDVQGLIGLFVNTLVIRADLSGDPSFIEFLGRVRERVLGAVEHQELPFERLVEDLRPERDLGYNPIFQSWFVMDNARPAQDQTGSLSLMPLAAEGTEVFAPFDLSLLAQPVEDGLRLLFTYSTDLFDAATIRRFADHLRQALETVLEAPATPVAAVRLLSAVEGAALLGLAGSVEPVVEPVVESVLVGFGRRVVECPGAVAVVCEGRSLTYAELDARARVLAGVLAGSVSGVEPRVGVCVARGVDAVVAMLGVWLAGAVFVPLDAAYPLARLEFMAADAGLSVVVCDAAHRGLVAGLSAGGSPVVLEDVAAGVGVGEGSVGCSAAGLGQLAYVIYTSGSTGQPKGVGVDHGSLAAHVVAAGERFAITADDSVLAFASFSFDASFDQLLPALTAGARVVIRPDELWLPALLPALIAERGVTVLNLTPAYWTEVVANLAEPAIAELSGLRLLILGGEEISRKALTTWREAVPWVSTVNAYGPTEATVTTAVFTSDTEVGPSVPIGRPLGGRRVYVLDSVGGLVPVGVAGELCVGGAELARGYLGRPGLSAQRFVPDPYGGSGARMYRTGDRVRWLPDGNLEFLGRFDDQVKLRGFRIELGEVQACLLSHRQVSGAVAAVREGAQGPRLVGYVVGEVSPSELVAWCARSLPAHMVPASVLVLDEFPLLPNGKINRAALPEPAATRLDPALPYAPPRNPTEQTIAEIWAEVLGVDQVGIDDGFFDLGGHSLLATMAISRIARELDRAVELRTLFEHPRIRDFAPAVTAADLAGGETIVAIQRGRALAPSFAQERLWFLDQLSGGSGEYQLWNLWRVHGELDRSCWQGALDDVAARHEVLRTSLVEVDGRPVQRVAAEVSVPLDWDDTPQTMQRAIERAGTFAAAPFDLSRAPLVRCGVWRLPDGDYLVVTAFHHAVSDGWSASVFTDDLTAFYTARLAGTTATRPAIPVQYADFAAWQRESLTGANLHRQLDYWRDALAGVPMLELPTDRERPTTRTGAGATVSRRLPAALLSGVEALGREHGATLFMTLLAAYQVVLARWSGQDDLVVGTPIAGRNRTETEGLIGLFVNTLVIRADLSGDPSFIEFLGRVRERVLGAVEHQDLPFERIVEELAPRRDLGRNPLFQVMFDINDRQPADFTAGAARFSTVSLPAKTAKFDLSLAFNTFGGAFSVDIEYATDLFDEDTIRRMADQVETLLHGIVAAGQTTVRGLELLSAVEGAALLGLAGSVEPVVEPVVESVLVGFGRRVVECPGAVAVVCEGRSLTYAELDARARVLAGVLAGSVSGVEPRVGVCVARGVDAVVAMLGVWLAGAVFVPLDAAYPLARLEFMAADAGLSVVVCDAAHRGLVAGLSAGGSPVVLEDVAAGVGVGEGSVGCSAAGLGQLAYVIYTSGSTGQPKGVGVDHGSLAAHVVAAGERFAITAADSVLAFASFSFDASFEQLLPALTAGARVVIRPDEVWTADELCQRVRDEQVSVMELVPSYWESFAAGLTHQQVDALSSLRLLVTGGEAVEIAPTLAWFDRLPAVPVINTYGPTEGVISATSYLIDGPASQQVPIGRPLGGRRVYVLDSVGGLVPVGVAGELCVGGAELARGYLGRPGLSAQRFVPDPYGGSGARMYRTGDRVRWLPDGNLEFLGRFDDQVKLRGFRIELGEVQACLLSHRQVSGAVAAVREGAQGPRLVGYVVGEVSPAELVAWCARSLPAHMVPASVLVLDEFPLLPNGKINRAALPEPAATDRSGTEFVAARTPTEDVIAAICAEVLELDQVGVEHNFFTLGGHSLRATVLASRLASAFGCVVKVRDVFEQPTVAALSVRVEQLLIDEIAAMSDEEIDLSLHGASSTPELS